MVKKLMILCYNKLRKILERNDCAKINHKEKKVDCGIFDESKDIYCR